MGTRVITSGLIEAVRRAEHELAQRMPTALALIGDRIVNDARRTTLFRDRTGRLRRSILRGPITGSFDSGSLTIDLLAGGTGGVSYALAVHEGTKPHDIHARHRKALRWVSGGGFIFARSVRHPGTRPRPFMREAAEANVPFAERVLNAAIRVSFARAGMST